MSINVGNLHRKRTLKRWGQGNPIIELLDETDGGYIVRGGQVVNQEKWDALLKKEEDKRKAAQASAFAVQAATAPEDRNQAPTKVQELEKKVESIESDIKKILNLLQK